MDRDSKEYWEWRATPDGIVKGFFEGCEAIFEADPHNVDYKAVASRYAQTVLIDVLNSIKRLETDVIVTVMMSERHFNKAEEILSDWTENRRRALDTVELSEKARFDLLSRIAEFIGKNDPDARIEGFDPFSLL